MGKLHEVLAVEGEVKTAGEAILNESINTFTKKHDHFEGLVRKYSPALEGGEVFPDEIKKMDTTVPERLLYTQEPLVRLIDLMYQKEETNTRARADLVVDGVVLKKDVPATVLLSLEKHFKHVKQMYIAIPTLEPGENWREDNDTDATWVADTKSTHRTNKTIKPLVLYPATDKHPAQVEKLNIDERVGTWAATKYSGKLRAKDKVRYLERLDKLIAGIKRARCRANEEEVLPLEIGKELFSYING